MAAATPSMKLLRSCSASYATRRRPERDTFGPELAKVAASLGQPMMPWQRDIADVGCEIDQDTGLPAYREVIVTVPRQSGKTTLFLSWQINRCLSPRWSHPQRSAFTAQTGKDARDKWLDELFPLIRKSPLFRFVKQISEGMGNEAIRWKNGSLIRILSSSNSSGHSKTLHQATLDEIWHDSDGRREQGLRPAMITIEDAQLLVCSTAGTELSVVLQRKVSAGRAAVAEDTGRGIAYFEYSAPEGWDPFDDESFYLFHPALCPNPPCRCGDGKWRHTITIDAILTERAGMELPEFMRAYGNIETASKDKREIPPDVWERVQSATAAPSGELRFGLDVSEDRSSGAIASCGSGVIELIDHRPGVGWVFDRAKGLAADWDATIVIDGGGPAAYIAEDLEKAGVRVERPGSADMAAACGRMYDDIADGRVIFSTRGKCDCHDDRRLFTHMDDAVAGLATKPAGDRKVWSRAASSSDITPFMAATLVHRPGGAAAPFMIRGR